jgi:hypothetical protein
LDNAFLFQKISGILYEQRQKVEPFWRKGYGDLCSRKHAFRKIDPERFKYVLIVPVFAHCGAPHLSAAQNLKKN